MFVKMTEIWKPIEGYENIYEVSNFGNVRTSYEAVEHGSVKRGRILKPRNNGKGYLRADLYDRRGGMKSIMRHRLVALAFIENPNDYPYIDHIDCDKSNNRVENLRWVTRSMNNRLRKPQKRKCGLPRGVSKSKSGNKFQAQTRIDGKTKHLGMFDTPEQASICFEANRKQKFNKDGLYNNLN